MTDSKRGISDVDDYLNDKDDVESSDSEYNGRDDRLDIKDNDSAFNGQSLDSKKGKSVRVDDEDDEFSPGKENSRQLKSSMVMKEEVVQT